MILLSNNRLPFLQLRNLRILHDPRRRYVHLEAKLGLGKGTGVQHRTALFGRLETLAGIADDDQIRQGVQGQRRIVIPVHWACYGGERCERSLADESPSELWKRNGG